jgi:hypothetical protein
MNDLLWLANHPLWGNVVGIPSSRDPDTPEGLESRLSIEIHRIPAELPHSTELELKKLCRTRMDFGRASVLKLLRGLPTSQKVLRPLEPRLYLYSTKFEFGSPLGGGGLNLIFFTLSAGGSTGVFIGGVRRCFGRRLGVWGPLVRPVGHATWPGGQVSLHCLWALDTLSTTSAGHIDKTVFGNTPTHGWLAKVVWPVGHSLARLSLCFVPHRPSMSYCLWLCLILDIMKTCMDFGSYGAFPSSDVLEMVGQQNSWNSLVISNYLLYLEWNIGMLMVNIRILWLPTPPCTHT